MKLTGLPDLSVVVFLRLFYKDTHELVTGKTSNVKKQSKHLQLKNFSLLFLIPHTMGKQ